MAEGGRQRFTVELRSGETTIVSWKKLIKDADNIPSAIPPPPPPHHSVDASGQVSDDKAKEGPPPSSRLGTVIEKIERLYVGKASSDDEDLNDVVPDEDEYDTEDSFIDDADLDDYFQVDNSAIKHDGFFVNRGKLERIEPTKSPNQQQNKKRRRAKDPDIVDVASNNPNNKHLKVGKKNEKIAGLDSKHPTIPSHIVALPSLRPEDVKLQNQVTAPEIHLKKKTKKAKSTYEPTRSDDSNGVGRIKQKKITQHKQVVGPSTNSIGEMCIPRNSHGQGKSSPGRSSNNVEEHCQATQQMEISSSHERPAITNPNIIDKPVQLARVQQRKEGSSVKPRSTMLEKAFRDLEKLVAESRPVSDVQDGENSSQSVKRRLPPEIKQKIAKVAKLAQASHGKISKEVLNRLMSIVGHMIQLRSLKRNLKIMVNMGLSAKQEKDHQVQLMKVEVADMVQSRTPLMKSKAQEELAGMPDDFQENKEQIEALKRKYSMDDSLEDKICDLYDLYVEGLEADAGPQVRKLYAELAAFWPSGFMDNHGIKRAICRAKDRRRPLQSHKQCLEKVKKALVQKPGGKVNVEAGSSFDNKLISSKTAANATSQILSSNIGISGTDRRKKEKMKSSGDTNRAELIPTKKGTTTPNLEQTETKSSPEESDNLLKEGMIERQHLTANMLRQLFET